MGAGASVNQDSLNSLKDEAAKPADGNDAADAKSAVLSLRKLISESGVGNFKQFKEEAGKPLDGIDIADDGKAEGSAVTTTSKKFCWQCARTSYV
eukprot:g1827.t1